MKLVILVNFIKYDRDQRWQKGALEAYISPPPLFFGPKHLHEASLFIPNFLMN